MASNHNDPFSKDAVQYVLNLPVLSLKEAQSQLSPPGEWVLIDDISRLLEAINRFLIGLRPRGMPNVKVVISRDMTKAALVRTKGLQQELGDNVVVTPQSSSDADNAESESDSLLDENKPFGSEVTKRGSRRAIEIAQELTIAYKNGTVANAEDFLKVLSTSPEPAVTQNFLAYKEKYPFDVSAPDFNFTSGGGAVFPQYLESAERFKVTLESIGDVNKNSVSARLISVNSGVGNPCTRSLSKNKRFTVDIGTSHDALLIRHPGVSLCDELRAEVTLTFDTAKATICGVTLIRILNKDVLKPFITEISKQIEIQFET